MLPTLEAHHHPAVAQARSYPHHHCPLPLLLRTMLAPTLKCSTNAAVQQPTQHSAAHGSTIPGLRHSVLPRLHSVLHQQSMPTYHAHSHQVQHDTFSALLKQQLPSILFCGALCSCCALLTGTSDRIHPTMKTDGYPLIQ
jgi:hypothetical protein